MGYRKRGGGRRCFSVKLVEIDVHGPAARHAAPERAFAGQEWIVTQILDAARLAAPCFDSLAPCTAPTPDFPAEASRTPPARRPSGRQQALPGPWQ